MATWASRSSCSGRSRGSSPNGSARGLPESRVVLKHSLRNALIATLTVLAVNLGWLIGGAVVIEKVFDIPGLGQLLVDSIFTRDFPVLQGLTLVFGLLVIAINLLS